MVTTTAQSLITRALNRLGVIGAGESVTADDAADALVTLNQMVGMWNRQGLMLPVHVRATYSVTAGPGPWTIGTTGTLVGSRPSDLDQAAVIVAGQTQEYTLDPWSRPRWQAEALKALTSPLPTALYYEPTLPNGTIYLWPLPSATVTLVLYHAQLLMAFADPATSYTFEDGYDEAFETNLAKRIAASYGKSLDALSLELARESEAWIKRGHEAPGELCGEAALLGAWGAYDIRGDR